MAGAYKAVGWNRQKRIYDAAIFVILLTIVAGYGITTFATHPGFTPETFIIRATALAALILLHIILCIGPLARLNPTFLPLLYNRRHLGVAMFVLALVHALFTVITFHALGPANPLLSIFTAYRMDYTSGRISDFPFEPFGFLALVIFFVMAATSHDFWLKFLGASFWKTLHLGVYLAYGAIIAHMALGIFQSETNPIYPLLLGIAFIILVSLHLMAGIKERRADASIAKAAADGFEATCPASELREGCGKTVNVAGERRALFLHKGRVYALSNVCRHQGGPISEGKILDGCITCPWHGWQYSPDAGVSPPPFHEVIETYPVRIEDGIVYVKPEALPLEQKSPGVALAQETA